jgi:hypothetical protein
LHTFATERFWALHSAQTTIGDGVCAAGVLFGVEGGCPGVPVVDVRFLVELVLGEALLVLGFFFVARSFFCGLGCVASAGEGDAEFADPHNACPIFCRSS